MGANWAGGEVDLELTVQKRLRLQGRTTPREERSQNAERQNEFHDVLLML